MSPPPERQPTRRRGTSAEEARLLIDQAEADGVARADMTLRMTLRDASELKRDSKVPLEDIGYSAEGMRYLGVWFQADSKWDVMEAHLRLKITRWTYALSRARGITAPMATLYLSSKVRGLLRFAFSAAPLSATFAQWVDAKMGRSGARAPPWGTTT